MTTARWLTPEMSKHFSQQAWKTAPWRVSHAVEFDTPLTGVTLCGQKVVAGQVHHEGGAPGCDRCRRELRKREPGRVAAIVQGAAA